MNLTADVITIDKKKALELLSNNTMNRHISHAQVRIYAKQMTEGNWRLIPAPIILSKEGILLQGQHRLTAVADTDTKHEFLMCTGVDKEIFSLLDQGMSRSGADVLYIDGGFNHPELYASLIYNTIKWDNHSFWGHGNKVSSPTAYEILEYGKANKAELCKSVNFVKDVPKRTTYFSQTLFVTSMHIIKRGTVRKEEEVTEFFRTLILADEEDCSEAQLYLREEMLANKATRRKLQRTALYSLIFYAWNGHGTNTFTKLNPETLRDVMPV